MVIKISATAAVILADSFFSFMFLVKIDSVSYGILANNHKQAILEALNRHHIERVKYIHCKKIKKV